MSEETPIETPKTELTVKPEPVEQNAGASVFDVPDDKGNSAAPDAQVKPAEQQVIRVQKKAIIEWKAGPDKEVTETVTHFRSLAALFDLLMGVLMKHPEKEKDYLEVYLQVETTDPAQPAPKLYIAKGELKEVLIKLRSKCVTAQQAVMEVQMALGHLSEISTLKGAILTVVFDDSLGGGLGFLTESNDVTDNDIMVLAESAAAQAELFKEKMRASKGIVFPSDKGKIIVPGGPMPPTMKLHRR